MTKISVDVLKEVEQFVILPSSCPKNKNRTISKVAVPNVQVSQSVRVISFQPAALSEVIICTISTRTQDIELDKIKTSVLDTTIGRSELMTQK